MWFTELRVICWLQKSEWWTPSCLPGTRLLWNTRPLFTPFTSQWQQLCTWWVSGVFMEKTNTSIDGSLSHFCNVFSSKNSTNLGCTWGIVAPIVARGSDLWNTFILVLPFLFSFWHTFDNVLIVLDVWQTLQNSVCQNIQTKEQLLPFCHHSIESLTTVVLLTVVLPLNPTSCTIDVHSLHFFLYCIHILYILYRYVFNRI